MRILWDDWKIYFNLFMNEFIMFLMLYGIDDELDKCGKIKTSKIFMIFCRIAKVHKIMYS